MRFALRRPRDIDRVNRPTLFCIRDIGALTRSTARNIASIEKRPAMPYPFGFVCCFSSPRIPSKKNRISESDSVLASGMPE